MQEDLPIWRQEVTADDIKWMHFPPEVDVTSLKKKYNVSDDGLVLTIKSVNEKRVGSYKCVVTKDSKVSEGLFEVTRFYCIRNTNRVKVPSSKFIALKLYRSFFYYSCSLS